VHFRDAPVLDRHVEIGAHENALAGEIELFHIADHYHLNPFCRRREKNNSADFI
jgi:hypothetical protein